MPEQQWFDIEEAATYTNLSVAYIRLLTRTGILETTQTPIKEGSKVKKHIYSRDELDAFNEREDRRAPRRRDGRKKHFFYATDDEVKMMKEVLYLSNDPGLKVVSESVDGGNDYEHWVPPSKAKSG